MKRGTKYAWVAAAAIAALAFVPRIAAQSGQQVARTVVDAKAYASLDPVPRGRTFEVALVAEIKRTYHINAHKVLEQYLIPTEIEGHMPAGFRIISSEYPAGELKQFSFAPKKLSVYTGQMIVKMKIQAAPNAPLGARQLPLSLRYQACNSTYCLPPVTVPVSVHLTVARAGAAAKLANPQIFRK